MVPHKRIHGFQACDTQESDALTQFLPGFDGGAYWRIIILLYVLYQNILQRTTDGMTLVLLADLANLEQFATAPTEYIADPDAWLTNMATQITQIIVPEFPHQAIKDAVTAAALEQQHAHQESLDNLRQLLCPCGEGEWSLHLSQTRNM